MVRLLTVVTAKSYQKSGRPNTAPGLPVLVLSQDVFNDHSGTVIAVAITSHKPRAGFPLTLRLKDGLLPKPSWVKMGQVRTLSSDRIGRRLAVVEPEILDQAVAGLDEIIGC